MTGRRTLIAIDWGTSAFRAYLVDPDGTIIDRRSTEDGILRIAQGGFPAALDAAVASWRQAYPEARIIASGMVGSRQGWHEVPYVDCPADAQALAGGLLPVDAGSLGPVLICPGVACRDAGGTPDVMRGEETQIIGALARRPDPADDPAGDPAETVFLLPGTHSKWAMVRAGRIISFKTYMTGELFAVLVEHSILGRLMTAPTDARARDGAVVAEDDPAFARGVRAGAAPEEGLLGRLFSTRTLGLFGDVPTASLRAYLSGLLIGAEIGEACRRFSVSRSGPIAIIGSAALARAYAVACRTLDLAATEAAPDAVVDGLAAIAAIYDGVSR